MAEAVGIGPFPAPNPFPLGARVRVADLLGTVVAVSTTDPKLYTVRFDDVRYEQLQWLGGPSK